MAGFAYQIKVFFLQILDLEKGAILEYETIDDIALRMTAEQIDEHEDDLLSVLTTTSSKAIQVKKTKVTKYAAKRVVKNWILAEESNEHIKEFVLVTNWENIAFCYFSCSFLTLSRKSIVCVLFLNLKQRTITI